MRLPRRFDIAGEEDDAAWLQVAKHLIEFMRGSDAVEPNDEELTGQGAEFLRGTCHILWIVA